MAVRTTMTPLISQLRTNGNASTTDEFLGVTYWTDQQLQDILDTHASPAVIQLVKHSDYSKTVYAVDMNEPYWLEEGFIIYVVGTTTVESTTYTYNHLNRTLTFDSDVAVRDLVIVGTQYVMSDATANLWNIKAQHREEYATFKAGAHRIEAKQIYEHCIAQRDFWYNSRVRSFPRLRRGLFS